MKKILSFKFLLSFLIIVLVAGIVGIYFWQHNKVLSLQKQNNNISSTLKSTKDSLEEKNNTLSNQLSKAQNQIQAQAQSNSFTAGSQCENAQLQLSWEKQLSGGLAADGGVFSFENISNVSCTLPSGHPGFLVLDSTGYVQPNGPISTDSSFDSDIMTTSLTLNSGDKAYFIVQWANANMSDTCSKDQNQISEPSVIESTPPGGLVPLVTNVKGNAPLVCAPNSVSKLTDLVTIDKLLNIN